MEAPVNRVATVSLFAVGLGVGKTAGQTPSCPHPSPEKNRERMHLAPPPQHLTLSRRPHQPRPLVGCLECLALRGGADGEPGFGAVQRLLLIPQEGVEKASGARPGAPTPQRRPFSPDISLRSTDAYWMGSAECVCFGLKREMVFISFFAFLTAARRSRKSQAEGREGRRLPVLCPPCTLRSRGTCPAFLCGL